MAPLYEYYAAKFDPFLSLDCARVEGGAPVFGLRPPLHPGAIQGMEGSHLFCFLLTSCHPDPHQHRGSGGGGAVGGLRSHSPSPPSRYEAVPSFAKQFLSILIACKWGREPEWHFCYSSKVTFNDKDCMWYLTEL